MDHDFWHARWKANEIGFHQAEVNAYLQTYWPRLNIPAGGTVFVPLCGKSRDMLWLASQGFKVIGVEISALAVEAFFTENGLQPQRQELAGYSRYSAGEIVILMGDYFSLQPEQLGDIAGVYDRASLIALSPRMRAAYAQQMAKLIPTGVASFLVSLDYPQAEMDGPPFAISATGVEQLFAADFEIRPLASIDILAENPRFQARGLSHLQEQLYRLVRR
ncbi:MAG: thiopurine S-methyltransferase [Gammaproteobacteria bacterium]|nr:thiopurine S-methyltransferase [Gammaproteobacteria bacterium]MBU2478179.1 thiopurine S-methyltransferase [Gammaproteobacteria bacterium]